MPPTTLVKPTAAMRAWWGITSVIYGSIALDFRRGQTVTVAGTEYLGGYWHGPLTAQQVTDITAAGYGARIYTADNVWELPADID